MIYVLVVERMEMGGLKKKSIMAHKLTHDFAICLIDILGRGGVSVNLKNGEEHNGGTSIFWPSVNFY